MINTSARTTCENWDQFGATNFSLQEIFSFCPLIPLTKGFITPVSETQSQGGFVLYTKGDFFSVQRNC